MNKKGGAPVAAVVAQPVSEQAETLPTGTPQASAGTTNRFVTNIYEENVFLSNPYLAILVLLLLLLLILRMNRKNEER